MSVMGGFNSQKKKKKKDVKGIFKVKIHFFNKENFMQEATHCNGQLLDRTSGA
jgi:hypothetical protein